MLFLCCAVTSALLLALLAVGACAAFFIAGRYETTEPQLSEAAKAERRGAMFPRLVDGGRVLSVVIPCYNEEERLAPMIADTIRFLTKEARRAAAVRERLARSEAVPAGDGIGDDFLLLPSPETSPKLSAAAVPPSATELRRRPARGDASAKEPSEETSARGASPHSSISDATADLIDAFEVIVVDDCSRDQTVAVARKAFADGLRRAAEKGRSLAAAEGGSVNNKRISSSNNAEADAEEDHPSFLTVIESKPNRGKGFAVRSGFFAAVGDYVLMADGDNATEISDASKLLKALVTSGRSPFDIAVGSRAHLEHESIAHRTFGRTLLMVAFHLVVKVTYAVATLGSICVIRDTQCGFKLFERVRCAPLFLGNRLERWAFDVELLILARRLRLRPVEVCVNWAEVPGSKVRLSGMVQMGLECLLMCFAYPLGLWGLVVAPMGK